MCVCVCASVCVYLPVGQSVCVTALRRSYSLAAFSTLLPPSRSSAVSQSQSGPLERDKESEDNSGMYYQSEEWSDYLDIVEEDPSEEGVE